MKWKELLFIFFFSVNLFPASAQTGIGHTQISFIDSLRQSRSIPAQIYYPADSTGDDVPLSLITSGKFPLIVFGHGFLMSWDSYAYLWQALVPEGYILIFPTTESGISPQHLEFGKDLAFLVGAMKNLGEDSTSIFVNRIDSTSCVMGHSMGGGASLLAVQFDSMITAVVNFAAAETNPSAIAASGQITIPALIFSGGNDCVTPPVTNQIPVYDSMQSQCKYFVDIIGGSHCQMADDNFYCNIGEASCTPAPTITRTVQHEIILRYLLPWLDKQLRMNCHSQLLLDSVLVNDSTVNYSMNCMSCSQTTDISKLNDSEQWQIYPNPFVNEISIVNRSAIGKNSAYQLLSIDGRIIQEGLISDSQTELYLDLHNLLSGMYFIRLKNLNSFMTVKLIKLEY
ncbi:MAG: T9SS type A sorting domain-containing protein [Bacteroidetes bacterium]|nr:MAG: T9SS type A sorting domain-containing protein [Bacteroidota bacterium]